MNNKINLLKEQYYKNKLSHAILIETNNQSFCVGELLDLVKILSCKDIGADNHIDCPLCKMIENNESINFFIIEPDGKNIKKEQMLELRSNCSKLPVLAMNNVYIIKNAECFNNSSANTILKFLEEPFDNCYGFFITNSKDNIINTIRSRCEIYSFIYDKTSVRESNNLTEEEFVEIKNNLCEYLKIIYEENNILVNKDILLDKYKMKENISSFFLVMLDIYNNYIDIKLNKKIENEYIEFNFIKNLNLSLLMKKKEIIINVLNNMSYNLNIDLMFDKFVIEMGEINE